MARLPLVKPVRFALELARQIEQRLASVLGVTRGHRPAAGRPQAQYLGFVH
jgi:hypothetical protein